MSNPDQIRSIHTLRRAAGLSDDDYRRMLSDCFGVTSSKDLADHQAQDLIQSLRNRSNGSGYGKEKYMGMGNRPGMATPAQLRMIEAMWKDVSNKTSQKEREDALDTFLKTRLSLSGGILWLEMKNVQKVVRVLQAMKRIAEKATAGADAAKEAA